MVLFAYYLYKVHNNYVLSEYVLMIISGHIIYYMFVCLSIIITVLTESYAI